MSDSFSLEIQKNLLAIISAWRNTLTPLKVPGQRDLPETDGLAFAILLESGEEADFQPNLLDLRKQLLALPYGQESVKARLEDLLNLAPRLKAACLNPWGLAKALDLLLFNSYEHVLVPGASSFSEEQLLSYLTQHLFETKYTRMALLHLYNLKIDGTAIEIPLLQARILVLTESDLPLVTGEPTVISTLHYEHGGNCFLVFEDEDFQEPSGWLSQKWDQTWAFISVLKYLKYGIIDLDYAGVFYQPNWLNNVRRYGIDIMGRPRWDAQPPVPYYLSNDLLPKLKTYLTATKALAEKLSDLSSDLRRSIALAGEHYEFHQTRMKLDDQLIELVIALEALFSPGRDGELTFRISQAVAILLGRDPVQRTEIFQFIRRMYRERSAFVHGGKNPIQVGAVKPEDVARLGDHVRQSILRFATLYVRGENTRNNILDEISLCALDPEKGESLRKRSDTDLLNEQSFTEKDSGHVTTT